MSTGDPHNFGPAAEPTKNCPFCGEAVKLDAKKCKHCGEIIDVVMREMQSMKESMKDARNASSGPNIVVTATGGGGGSSSSSSSSSASAAASAGPVVGIKPEGSILWLIFWSCFYIVPGLIYYSMRRWPWQS